MLCSGSSPITVPAGLAARLLGGLRGLPAARVRASLPGLLAALLLAASCGTTPVEDTPTPSPSPTATPTATPTPTPEPTPTVPPDLAGLRALWDRQTQAVLECDLEAYAQTLDSTGAMEQAVRTLAALCEEFELTELTTVEFEPVEMGPDHARVRVVQITDARPLRAAAFRRNKLTAEHTFVKQGHGWRLSASEVLGIEFLGEPVSRTSAGAEPWEVRETVLAGDLAAMDERSAIVSPDGLHVAYVASVDGGQAVWHDGTLGPTFQQVRPGSLLFSSDGSRLAYVAESAGQVQVVVDGEALEPRSEVRPGSLLFSPDGRRFAYAVEEGGESFYVVDDLPRARHLQVGPGLFDPGGSRFAYLAADEPGQLTFYLDDRPLGSYELIPPGGWTFSQDGSTFAFMAAWGASWHVVVNGRESLPYEEIEQLTVSAHGERVVFGARRGASWYVVDDGQEVGPYDAIVDTTLVLSPDGMRLAYGARTGRDVYVHLEGEGGEVERQGPYDKLGLDRMTFSPDGKRLAYVALVGTDVVAVIDGLPGDAYADICEGYPLFSPDSQRVIYCAVLRSREGVAVVIDGRLEGIYDATLHGGAAFSPDGRRLAYTVRLRHEELVYVDGQPHRPFQAIIPHSVSWSPDGEHLAYIAMLAGGYVLVIDGQETAAYDFMGLGPPVWTSADTVQLLAIRGKALLRLELRAQ